MEHFRHALWSVAKSVVDVSGYSGAGAVGKALRRFLRDENDPDVLLSSFGGLSLAAFFAHSQQALQRVEEEIRIGIRTRMPLKEFARKLRAEDTLAVLALDVAQGVDPSVADHPHSPERAT